MFPLNIPYRRPNDDLLKPWNISQTFKVTTRGGQQITILLVKEKLDLSQTYYSNTKQYFLCLIKYKRHYKLRKLNIILKIYILLSFSPHRDCFDPIVPMQILNIHQSFIITAERRPLRDIQPIQACIGLPQGSNRPVLSHLHASHSCDLKQIVAPSCQRPNNTASSGL